MLLLAQGRYWRASLTKDSVHVALDVLKAALPESLVDLRDLKIEVPLGRWNAVVKHARSDRKLLGGLLLAYATATHKDRVSAAVNSDPLVGELQRVVVDATASLVEKEILVLARTKGEVD